MKRYEPRIEDGIVFNGVRSRNIVLRQRPDGMVVLFSDVQSIQAENDRLNSEVTSDAELIKRLNASLAEAQAERDRLREALNGLMPWVSTGEVGHCNGDKCRELWCADCFGEEQAEGSIEKARQAMIIAREALSKFRGEA